MNDQRTPADTIHRDDTLLSAVIDGEVVLMSVEKGRYYALDAIASDIWELLIEAAERILKPTLPRCSPTLPRRA